MIHGKIMGTSKTEKKSIYEVKIPSRLNPSWPKPLVPLITGFSTSRTGYELARTGGTPQDPKKYFRDPQKPVIPIASDETEPNTPVKIQLA